MAQRGVEHSSRRQQRRANNTENGSDIECTAHRVASVTLNTESDSRTSADMPLYSFRSKRRKKLPRRDKQQTAGGGGGDMDVDEEHQPPWKKLSVTTSADNTNLTSATNFKVQMDWEHEEEEGVSSTVKKDGTTEQPTSSTTITSTTTTAMNRPASEMENIVSDHFSRSQSESEASTSNIDADDEQSDWPGNNEIGRHHHHPAQLSSGVSGGAASFQLAPPQQSRGVAGASSSSASNSDQQKEAAALSAEAVKRIEHFLQSADDRRELLLDKVYRTSAVKQVLRRQFADANVQIVKRGRGTVALKKL